MKISLKAARVNAGLTQKQVEDATGIARSTLIRWERGDTIPSRENLTRLCKLYGIEPEELRRSGT